MTVYEIVLSVMVLVGALYTRAILKDVQKSLDETGKILEEILEEEKKPRSS